MKNLTRATLLSSMLLLSLQVSRAQVSVGIRVGPPPRPRVVAVVPYQPGPEFVWVDGYWYPVGRHYRWHGGYWTRPPYQGARWVGPRHDGERFYSGYWEGDRGRFEHRHEWDRNRHRRDRDRYREHRE
jgi:hypothetical protein